LVRRCVSKCFSMHQVGQDNLAAAALTHLRP
jgi:hypothetical protein